MDNRFYEIMEQSPVIAAVKNDEDVKICNKMKDIRVVFVLYGNICTISEIVEALKRANKVVIVHLDLIAGLGSKEASVDFVRGVTMADGIISTKPALVKRAGELNLYTVLRMFILDSMSFRNIEKQSNIAKPDIIEILPGIMPQIIGRVCEKVYQPVIASGLIFSKEDVINALKAGAIAISSTDQAVWNM